ncbi:uncharacterized protein HKW66_Vig0117550 [Vigna angularis]|uniref:Uncharacterized protein n=1 Tax=Phaseolus angularis TaxID=3914 RepID=A0A8T0JVT2_PHAAN|nr:uncharacterized protein HKW66_Vig0117550 [Vigna angularis]
MHLIDVSTVYKIPNKTLNLLFRRTQGVGFNPFFYLPKMKHSRNDPLDSAAGGRGGRGAETGSFWIAVEDEYKELSFSIGRTQPSSSLTLPSSAFEAEPDGPTTASSTALKVGEMQDKSQMELRLTVAALRSADLVASQLDLRLMATTGGSAVGSRWRLTKDEKEQHRDKRQRARKGGARHRDGEGRIRNTAREGVTMENLQFMEDDESCMNYCSCERPQSFSQTHLAIVVVHRSFNEAPLTD